MEMKPEFVYATIATYHMHFNGNLVRGRRREIYKIFHPRIQMRYELSLAEFLKHTEDRDLIAIPSELSPLQYQELCDLFDAAQIPYESMCFITHFSTPFQKLPYSLAAVGEYSLPLWAEAYHIPIAYRLMVEGNGFFSESLRVWCLDNIVYRVKRKTNIMDEIVPEMIESTDDAAILAQWAALQHYMEAHFWTWEGGLWEENNRAFRVLDGVRYVFEGYQQGDYKEISSHQPEAPLDRAAQAVDLFNALREW